ncbi:hypothetical protein WR25_14159 [Diploscapter pachys]|uniref:Uncharacterized protein n=1 Tax=Diploscapter pachys TaxID=2018661 RepID=A0A2A2KM72_9BILA|nr:hypothetical protein WR25_14159 [Diploscapter pachys]
MVYIGIDLGTTYSCVAIVENCRPVAIHNDDGRNTLPSVVAFNGNEILVGNLALDCNTDMGNILYDSKRLIGWHVLSDLPIADDRQLWTFNADTKKKYKGQKVIEAVVTVPAMFHPDQITATKKAIELAGLKLKCLLQEPTAAAIAYNDRVQLGNSKLLVFDLGGDYDIYKKPKLLKRLRVECRKAKESLSSSNDSVNVHLDINDDLEINVRLTKEKFNELCSDLFERAMTFVDRALNTAQLSPEKIDHVILVGGSTRIPKVEQNIKNKFRNSNIQFDINPDEAVAYGAAIIADALEKGISMPLITNTMNELTPNINNSQIDENNSSNDPLEVLFYCPVPSEWRMDASVAYFKDKLYYLGGLDPEKEKKTNCVDLLMVVEIEKYIDYQTMGENGWKVERFQKNEFISELHR